MISFAHFENFDNQSTDFKNGFEKEKSEFDSFMLAFSFAPTPNNPENPKFELNPDEANVAVESAGEKSSFPDESIKTTNEFQEFEDVFLPNNQEFEEFFLPNDKAAFPIDKVGDLDKIQGDFSSDKKNILKSEAFADLQNFGKAENLSSEETDFVNTTITEKSPQSNSTNLNVVNDNSLQTNVENSTDSVPVSPDIKNLKDVLPIRPSTEISADFIALPLEKDISQTSVDLSEFHVEIAPDNENIDSTRDLNLQMIEQKKTESIRKLDLDPLPESQKTRQTTDSISNPVKRIATEAEIEQIMELKFLASEIEQNKSDVDETAFKSAEKINLWQFKSPEFHDYKNISKIISDTAEVPDLEPIQDLKQFEIVNSDSVKKEEMDVASDNLTTESLPIETDSNTDTESIFNSELNEIEDSSVKTDTFIDSDFIKANDSFNKAEPIFQEKVAQLDQNPSLTNDAEIIGAKTPTELTLKFSDEIPTSISDDSSNEVILDVSQNVFETEQHLSKADLESFTTNKVELVSKDAESTPIETESFESNFEAKVIDGNTIINNEIDSSTTINNEAEKIVEGDSSAPIRNDLGEKIISNLSNRPPIATFPQDHRLDLGEKAVENPSNTTPQPIHRQDSEEINLVDMPRKFPKLIHEVSEYFDKADPVKTISQINSSETEDLLNLGDIEVPVSVDAELAKTEQSDVPVVDLPEIASLDVTMQDTSISENNTPDNRFFDDKAELPTEKAFQSKEKTDSWFEIDPPVKERKPPTELPKPQVPGKHADIFRVNNAHIEGGNWADSKVENQNLGEQTEVNELIELPVSEQVENPILEYLTSEKDTEKPEILKLRLHPAELGMVEVRLEKHFSGKLEVHFQAENERAKQVLAESFEKLRESLQNNGWQIGRLEISNSLLSSNGFKNGGENPSGSETPQSYDGKTDNEGGFSDESDDLNQNEPDRLVNLRA